MVFPVKENFYMPAEWHLKQRTFMEWPIQHYVWQELLSKAKQAYVNVARAIAEFEPVTIVVNAKHETEARKLCGSQIDLICIEHDDSWMRDNGPTFVINNHEIAGISWRFNCWGDKKHLPYDNDAKVASTLLKALAIREFKADIVLEGGSIHVDGQGTLLTTEECLLNPNRNPHLFRSQIEEVLNHYLGIKKIIWLKKGLFGDETDGHIDNVATFIKPGLVVMQSCADKADPNHAIYQENLAILKNATDAKGNKIEIVTIPQPPICYYNNARLTLSYINYYPVNGGIILPVFGGTARDSDHNAAAILQELYPDRKIVPVDGSIIIRGGGNIHCITQQMPSSTSNMKNL